MEFGVIIGVAGVALSAVTLALTGEWQRLNWVRGAWQRRPEAVIGVVIHHNEVLVVHRRPEIGSRLHWQFPSAFVRGEEDLARKVSSEILAETGLIVDAQGEIGRRTHPMTGRRCVYLRCSYRSGTVQNLDPSENIDVRWIPKSEVEAYFGGKLFSKVKLVLK